MRLSRLMLSAAFASAVLFSLPVRQYAQTQTAAEINENTKEDAWKKAIEADLVNEKFDDLDHIADTCRRDKSRFKGGDWKLRVFYEVLDAPRLTDKDSVDHLAHLSKWAKLRPESITAKIALATSLDRWAWVARGNGLAPTVTPDGWRLFTERSGEAQAILVGAQDMHQMDPQWYAEMITVGRAQQWDPKRVKDVFDRGVQYAPDYFYLYKEYADYILPKWFGKLGDSAKFANASADKLGGSAGDELYYQISATLIRRGDGNYPVKQLDWERIQKGYAALGQEYGVTKRMKNELAFMAWKYEDVEVARQQFAAIGDNWATAVWRDKQFFDKVRDWSTGRNS